MPAEEKVLVAELYKSAILPGVLGLSLLADPPSTRTLPSGNSTAFNCTRAEDMLGPEVQAGDATDTDPWFQSMQWPRMCLPQGSSLAACSPAPAAAAGLMCRSCDS